MLVYRKRPAERTYFERPEGMPRLLHALLIQRGIASREAAEAFLNPGEEHLRDPLLLSDMGAAVGRLRAALEKGEQICIYGDYDVDGVAAAAILSLHLTQMGAPVKTYLPDRHQEGYGLNEAAVRRLAAEGTRLLVTVDCGVGAADLTALAAELGMDVIVTDHHRPGAVLPACTLVNPLLNDYPCPCLSGAGVAFKLVEALSGRAAALEYVDLAALSTVADVVPLLDENRAIVRLGLARMNQRPRPGISALQAAAGLEGRTLTSGHLGFQLGPRLNAGGRLGSARRSLELLMTRDEARAARLAGELEEENGRRRRVETEILAQAEEMLLRFDFPAHRAIVLAREGWNTGVLGLAASRLAEKYHYPVVLLSEADGVLKGSCRSIEGVDIFAALTAADEHLLRFGGHRQAAGLTLAAASLEPFRAKLEAHLHTLPADVYVPGAEYDLQVRLDDLDAYSVAQLEALSPTGMGNPAPVLRARARVCQARAIGRDGAHLRFKAEDEQASVAGVMFGAGARAGELAGEYDLLFTPRINAWMGRTTVEMEARALEPLDARERISANLAAEDGLVIRFLTEMLYNRGIEPVCAPAVDADALIGLLQKSPQGTLLIALDVPQALFLADALRPDGAARFDLAVGAYPADKRCFNAVCLLPPGAPPPGYRQVFFAGQVRGAPACRWAAELPDVNGLRDAYRAVREALRRPLRYQGFAGLCRALSGECALTGAGMAAALCALDDLRLVQIEDGGGIRLLPMTKCDPMQSETVLRILRLREGR